jgi:hypothetical protein
VFRIVRFAAVGAFAFIAIALLAAACSTGAGNTLQPVAREVPTSPPAPPTPTAGPTRTPAAALSVDAVDDVDCPASAPSFAGKNIADTRFAEDLTCASFVGATLDSVTFAATSLNGADFTNAVLRNVEFDTVTTRGADFSGASFEGAEFEDSDLEGGNFLTATFSDASFEATLCPDGSTSPDNQTTCLDNLGSPS